MRTVALIVLVASRLAWGLDVSPELVTGRALTEQLLDGNIEQLWARATPSLRRQFGNVEGLAGFARKVKSDFGVELRMGGERVQERGPLTVYSRLSVFSRYARGVELQWTWNDNQQLVAVSARPAVTESPSPHQNTTPKTPLRLPVEGPWNVLWGGRTWEENRHASVADQRYALDLVIWKRPGTFEGDGTSNEQYFCWGKAVVAPAEGTVVIAEDGILDNTPGWTNPKKLYGNHLVIDHGNSEYSLLAHLMRNSLTVKVGDQVQPGQLLGKTGNSGVSTEPHLHYQLMDAPQWLKAHGLPSVFVDFTADGKQVVLGEPKRGQTVSHRAN